MSKEIKVNLIKISTAIAAVIAILIGFIIAQNNGAKIESKELAEINKAEALRTASYTPVDPTSEYVNGTNNEVKFSAYFVKDTNNDGEAERYLGACNSISSTDTLYFELGVEGNGYVESPVISVNGNNFKLSMTYFEDALVNSNLFSSDVKRISLKTLTSANGRILRGPISANVIYEDQYSKDSNQIIFSGTYVDGDGNRSTVRKDINLTADWYGTASGRIKDGYTSLLRKAYVQDEEEEEDKDVDVNFSFSLAETSYELVVKQNIVEVTIPQCMGDDPVTATSSKGTSTYDAASRKLRIEYNTNKRENNFVITATYKQSTLNKLKNSDSGYKLTAPVKANIVCHNNPNMEEVDNPYVTRDITGNAVVSFDVVNNEVDANYSIDMQLLGTYIADQRAYVVSKQPIIDQYGTEEVQPNINYTTVWYVETTSVTIDEPETITFEEGKGGDASKYGDTINGTVMDDYISYTGISMYNKEFIPTDGYVRVYNEDTNELLKEFSGADLVSSTPVTYTYETPVKHVKVVTSASTKEKYKFLRIINNKEIDVQKVREDYTLDQIVNMTNLQTKLTGKLGNDLDVTGTRDAKLLGNACELNLRLSRDSINSTNKTENFVMSIDLKKDNIIYSGWKDGIFLVEIPSQIASIDVKSITSNDSRYKISGYDVYKENGKTYLKIVTQNDEIANTTLSIVCDLIPNPLTTPGNIAFYVFGVDGQGKTYWTSTTDYLDIDGDGDTSERVGYSGNSLYVLASEAFISAASLSNYNDNADVNYAPDVAVINQNTESARVNVVVKNNYRANVKNVEILGKIPFENNTYVGGGELGSTFTATMKNTGIQIPAGLENKVVIYYTDVENPTKDITEAANKWKVSTEWESLATVRNYLITIPTQQFSYGTGYTFTYDVSMPNDLVSNDKAYVAHKVYFELDTGDGWLSTEIQPAKVGMRVASYYNLNAKKYKTGTNLSIANAVFKVWEKVELDEDSDNARLVISDSNGNISLGDLVVNQIYYIQEVRVSDEYVLDSTVREFKVVENAAHELSVQVLSEQGFVETPTMSKGTSDEDLLNIKFENDPKFELNITKIDEDTNEPMSGITFTINSRDYTTRGDGTVSIKNLQVGTEYELGEYRKDGYYGVSNIKFKVVKEAGNTYSFDLISGSVEEVSTITNDGTTALVNVPITITNKKVPTYSLKIEKVAINDENGEVTKLQGTKFLLRGEDSGSAEYLTTDENGQIELDGLYQRVADRDTISGRYTLTEAEATAGYMLNNEDIEFYAQLDGENKLQLNITNSDQLTSINDVIVEGDKVKLVIEDKPVLKIRKVDSDTGAPLANAEFTINEINTDGTIGDFAKDVEGNYIGTQNENGQYVVVTDSNGIITAALRDGKYRLSEVKAPDGYINAGATETFVVKSATKYESTDVEELPTREYTDNTTEVIRIKKIEDLLDVALRMKNFETTFADTKIILDNDLDFTDRGSYKYPDSKAYGDINEDGNTQTLFEELGARDENGYGYGDGFPMIGGMANSNASDEIKSQCISDWNYPFRGIFDGNNKQIKNLYINNKVEPTGSRYYTGLFRSTKDALIKDLTVTGDSVSNSAYFSGSIVGYSLNTYMVNVHSSCNTLNLSGSYSGSAYNGGLIGVSEDNIYMDNCSYSGTNTYGYYAAGLIGWSRVSSNATLPIVFNNCSNSGNIGVQEISNSGYYCGGLVGCLQTTLPVYMYNCKNSGNLVCNGQTGGLAGKIDANNFYVNNCSNEGNIESRGSRIGGLFGEVICAKMTNCYNTGAVAAYDAGCVGGLIGQSNGAVTVDNCYNKGRCSATGSYGEYVGGLIGYTYGLTQITNSYNGGAVSGYDRVAGLVGRSYISGSGNPISFENCYNLGRIEFQCMGAGLYGNDNYGDSMRNCYNVGSIVANSSSYIYASGLAYGMSIVEDCYNKGDIIVTQNGSGTIYIGGISYWGNNVKDCYNIGDITVNTTDSTSQPSCYVYGIGQGGSSRNPENCYNAGNIYISGTQYDQINAYGISVTSCKNCYNVGNIENHANSRVIYMAGITSNNAQYCYNTGSIINNMTSDQSNCYAYVGGITASSSMTPGSYNTGNVYNIVTSPNYAAYTIKANPIYGGATATDTVNSRNYSLDTIELAGKDVVAVGDYSGVVAVTDEYMRTEEFYNELVNHAGENSKWVYRAGSYPTLDIAGSAPGQINADFRIENQRNAFDITAEVALDTDGFRLGGSTSGTYTAKYKDGYGVKFVERVDAGENSTQSITFTPDEEYRVSDVSVNGNSIGYAEESDGKVILPAGYFEDVNEAKKVVVSFAPKNKLLTIEKVDKNDNTKKLQGAEFEINQIDERAEPDGSEIGTPSPSGTEYKWIDDDEEELPLTINLQGSYKNCFKGSENTSISFAAPQKNVAPQKNETDEYTFVQDGSTWVSNSQGTTGTIAHAYTEIDLSGNEYIGNTYGIEASLTASCNNGYHRGLAIVTESADTPALSTSYIISVSNKSSQTGIKYVEGGKKYYVHFMYDKKNTSNAPANEDKITVNSVKVYDTRVVNYNMIESDGKIKSSNYTDTGTYAWSCTELDLSSKSTDDYYAVVVNCQSDNVSNNYIYGAVNTSATQAKTGTFICSDVTTPTDYPMYFSGGKKYYIHLGYYCGASTTTESVINSVKLYKANRVKYGFNLENGAYKSTNQGTDKRECKVNTIIDLTPAKFTGKYTISFDAQLTGTEGVGTAKITHYSSKGYSTVTDVNTSTVQTEPQHIVINAMGGTKYWFTWIYTTAAGNSSTNDDTFTISNLKVERDQSDYLFDLTATTNEFGRANIIVQPGKYSIVEKKAPDDYLLDETPTIYEVTTTSDNIVQIENETMKKVTAHYIEDTTEEKLKDDVVTYGVVGTEYETEVVPKIQKYTLKRNAVGAFQIPSNAKGEYGGESGEEDVEVTYRYETNGVEYRVHYLYNNEEDDEALETDSAAIGSVINTYTDKAKDGYRFVRAENLPLTIDEDPSKNDIYVYYEKKVLNYEVHYFYDGVEDTSKAELENEAVYGESISTFTDKNIAGHVLQIAKAYGKDVSITEEPLVIGENEEENIINVYYVKGMYDYTVKYFYDGVEDPTKAVTESAEYQSVVDTYEDKNRTGYVLQIAKVHGSDQSLEDNPLVISDNANENIIEVYYVIGNFGYTIEYYYDNVIDNNNTVTGTAVYGSSIETYTSKPKTGYKFSSVTNCPLTITEVAANNVMKVYYVKDNFGYRVDYYYDGVKDATATETGSALFGATVDTYTDKVITGYKLEIAKVHGSDQSLAENPLVISENADNNVIDVYYVKDSFGYTIEYYYDDVKDDEATVTGTALFGATIETYTDKNKTGYKFHRVTGKPLTITEVAANNVMKVYYVKDSFAYTVNYYYDNVKDDEATVSDTALYGAEINTFTQKNKEGYAFVIAKAYGKAVSITEEPLVIGTDTSKNVINVYYEKQSYAYSVHYFIDEVEDDNLKEDGTALYGATVDSYPDKCPTGYKLTIAKAYGKDVSLAEEPLVIGTDVSKNVINVYYEKDSFEYTVRYFYEGSMDPDKSETGTALYGSEVSDYTRKVIDGYKFEKVKTADRTGITGDLPLVITEHAEDNLINVYYILDDLGYTINYYYDGVKDDLKTENKNSTIGEEISTYPDKNIDGYKLEIAKAYGKNVSLTEEPLVIGTDSSKNIINVYYVKDSFAYTVKYYLDGVEDTTKEHHGTALYGSSVDTYPDKCPAGFKFDKTEGLPLTISHIPANNVIKVYYVRKQGKITVTYVDNLTGDEIVPPEETTGPVGDEYHIERKDIPGYRLDTDNLPGNEDGTYSEDGDTVVYTYIELRPYELEVRYIADVADIEDAKINVSFGSTTIDEYTTNGRLKIKDIELTELGEETYTVFESYTPKYCKTIVSEDDPGVVRLVRQINSTHTDYEFVADYADREGFEVIVDKVNKKVIIDITTEVSEKYDLAIKKFITKIGENEITSRVPEAIIADDGKVTYKTNNNIESAMNNQKITYTLRVYNESEQDAKGKRIIEHVPDGLVFVPGDITNMLYGWSMYKIVGRDLVETSDPSEAKVIVSDYLVDRNIAPLEKDNKIIYFLDVQAVFRVDETRITNDDRIVENKVSIQPSPTDDNKDNDSSTEKVYIKFFDLKMEKYIEKVVINTNGNETVKEYGYDKKDDLVKIDVKKSQVPNTVITVTYGLKVTNVGEIPGYATELTDYLPEDFSLVSGNWRAEGNKAVSDELKDTVIEPGESKTVMITLEWKLAKGPIGLKSNEAEITEYANDYDAEDVTKDNKDNADLLVTVKTGSNVIAVVTIITVVVGFIAIIAYKKRKSDEEA